MVPFNILVLVCLVYVGLLFLVAFLVERRAHARALPWLRSPLIYTLSLSIYSGQSASGTSRRSLSRSICSGVALRF